MSKRRRSPEEAALAIRRAVDAMEAEILLHLDAKGTVSSLSQLQRITAKLKEMLAQVEAGTLPPQGMRDSGLGRVIMDDWPLDHELGNLILEAGRIFRDL